jgi:NTE family protein
LQHFIEKFLFNKNTMLKNIFTRLLLCSILIFAFNGFSQERKPKVALVLSGGGAKGIAHIPLLQKLDSLGIVPDLIVGNSMGSVVGGLYAMGYSGDSIASIVKQAKWQNLIGGKVSLQNVSVEEKTEFGRYLVDFDYSKGKVKVGKFLLNDQNLRQFISLLTFPSYTIDNFDNFPIPFRAVATDILKGELVVLDRGSLALAMRASMSLPGVFSPVPYDDKLLIDGAILNNFPVDVAKDLGAAIIIGSDVGEGMMKKDELENISSLLFQAGMLSSNLKNPKNRALCDILINHTEHLTYGTADFEQNQDIYNEGKIAVAENSKALEALALQMKNYKQLKVKLPRVVEDIKLDTVIFNKINKTNLPIVIARTNIQTGQVYSREGIIEGISRAMGTTIFTQITFEPFSKNGKLGLKINGLERSKHQIKGALHYDDFHGVGILLNYTGRNILGAASRTLISADIAEQPRLRIQHQKNFGSDRNWWWRTEGLGQLLKQQSFFNVENGSEIDNRYLEFENQVNRNITSLESYAGVFVNYQLTNLEPKVNLNEDNSSFILTSYTFNAIQVGAHYVYNTFNTTLFATDGTAFRAQASRSLNNEVKLSFSNSNFPEEKGSVANFTKFGWDYERRIPLSETLTGCVGVTGNFIVIDQEDEDDLSFSAYGLGAKYFIGGNELNPRRDNFMFSGLNQSELTVTQFTKVSLGLQYNFKPKLYIIPHVELAAVGHGKFDNYVSNLFDATSNWRAYKDVGLLLSSGVNFGYNSILGPVTFDVSWVNDLDKARISFGVGFPLNRS